MKNSILVIDDSEEMLEVRKLILELEGYDVLVAISDTVALHILEEKTPDLILLDFKMQDMNGDEFLIMLEAEMPHIIKKVPVVFFSGMAEVPETKASGFISKMTPIPDLLREIASYLIPIVPVHVLG